MSDTIHGISVDTILALHRATFGDARMEGEPPAGEPPAKTDGEQQPPTFTQADVDRIVRERVKRERDKFADYDQLKAKAEGAKPLEDRLATLEKDLGTARHEALRSRVQARHGISDDDADLFLTGTDEDTLTAQAKRLAERDADRNKKKSNHVPTEGSNPPPAADGMRDFTRKLFGTGNSD